MAYLSLGWVSFLSVHSSHLIGLAVRSAPFASPWPLKSVSSLMLRQRCRLRTLQRMSAARLRAQRTMPARSFRARPSAPHFFRSFHKDSLLTLPHS